MEMSAWEIFQKYMGTGLVTVWFLLALVYLFLQEKRRPLRILFIYAPVVVLLLFFNPLFYKVFGQLLEQEIYFRLCWLLPVIVVLAYTAVCICEKLAGAKRISFGAAAVCLAVLSGKLVYTSPLFSAAENCYHVPQTVVTICDAIEIPGREVMAAFPDEFLLYVRQYSPTVCMPYGRNAGYVELQIAMKEPVIDAEKLAELAKASGCHYVILAEERKMDGTLQSYGYEVFDNVDGYVVYKDPTMNYETSVSL